MRAIVVRVVAGLAMLLVASCAVVSAAPVRADSACSVGRARVLASFPSPISSRCGADRYVVVCRNDGSCRAVGR